MTYFILFIVYDDCYVGCDIFMCTFIAYFVRNYEIKMFNHIQKHFLERKQRDFYLNFAGFFDKVRMRICQHRFKLMASQVGSNPLSEPVMDS